MMDQPTIALITEKFHQRSRSALRAAWMLVAVMILTVFGLIYIFFAAHDYSSSIYSPVNIDNEIALTEQRSKESDEVKKIRLELDLKKAQIEQETSRNSGLTFTIAAAVVRIGSVLIALYLVQILLSLTRYHLRLADHLAACGHALMFSADDPMKVVDLVPILSASHIDFGRPPNTPIEKIIDVIKESLSKQKAS